MPKIIKNGIEYGSASHAENVSYDRSRTTPPNILASNNVQDAIDEVAEGISSVSSTAQGLISTKQNKITNTGETLTFTSSTTASYTGKSITCPTGYVYIVRARAFYNNSIPIEFWVSQSSTSKNNYEVIAYAGTNGSTYTCSTVTFTMFPGETYYYWARYAGANSNDIKQYIIKIPI